MTETTTELNPIERYQDFRTRRFLKNETKRAKSLPGWRTRRRRRSLVVALAVIFAFMFAVSILCAVGLRWAPLLWLPACAVFFPLWAAMQIVSGRRGDAPRGALDEFEIAQRNSARSIGLTITQALTMIPAFYLIFGATLTDGADPNMAYAGGVMVATALLVGGCSPAMILGWIRPDPDPEDRTA